MLPIAALLDVGMKVLDKVIPDPEAKAKAQVALMEMQQKGELAQIQAEIATMQETTKRWEADMKSDSWLSKNIRPMTLVFILGAYTTFALMSAWDMDINESYVRLLGEWGQLIMLAYFGGRTIEKIMSAKENKKQ